MATCTSTPPAEKEAQVLELFGEQKGEDFSIGQCLSEVIAEYKYLYDCDPELWRKTKLEVDTISMIGEYRSLLNRYQQLYADLRINNGDQLNELNNLCKERNDRSQREYQEHFEQTAHGSLSVVQHADLRSLEDMFALSASAHQEMSKLVSSFPRAKVGPIKDLARSVDKIVIDYSGNHQRLLDIVRSSIVCGSISEMIQVVHAFASAPRVLRLKNGFTDALTSGGYRDLKMNVVLAGLVCEIQVHLQDFFKEKNDRGHDLYNKIRELKIQGSLDASDLFEDISFQFVRNMDFILDLSVIATTFACRSALQADSGVFKSVKKALLTAKLNEAQYSSQADLEFLKRVHQDHLSAYGEMDPETLFAELIIAKHCYSRGDFASAIELAETCKQRCLQSVGDKHPLSIDSQLVIALAKKDANSIDAFDALENVRKQFSLLMGKNHPMTLQCELELAHSMVLSTNVESAAEYIMKTLASFNEVFGNHHPKTLEMRSIWYEFEFTRYQYNAAFPSFIQQVERLLDDQIRAVGNQQKSTATTCALLSRAYMRNGDYDKAREYASQSLNMFEMRLGKNHFLTQRAAKLSASDIDETLGFISNLLGTFVDLRGLSNEKLLELKDTRKRLISEGISNSSIDVNAKINTQGPNALCLFAGEVEYAKLLLQIDLDLKHGYAGKTPLIGSIYDPRGLDVTKLLLQKDPTLISVVDDKGMTALHHAASADYSDTEMGAFLLECKSDPNSRDQKGNTPLHLAVRNEFPEFVKLLLDWKAEVNAQNIEGKTALELACQLSTAEAALKIVKNLVERGANVNLGNSKGQRPLHFASEHGNPELVNFLLDHGAEIDAQDENDFTPLFASVRGNNASTCQTLLNRNAWVDNCDRNFETVLIHACRLGHLKIVRILLRNGAQAQQSSRGGRGPLLEAVARGSLDIVKILVEHKAFVSCYSQLDDAETPLSLAVEGHFVEIVKLLVECGADVDADLRRKVSSLMIAVKEANEDVVKLLVEKNCRMDQLDRNGYTALHYACELGLVGIVRLLLSLGTAEILQKAKDGMTPLDIAARQNHLQIVEELKNKLE